MVGYTGSCAIGFQKSQYRFTLNNRRHVLRGGKQGESKLVDAAHMQKLLQKKPHGFVAHINAIQVVSLTVANVPEVEQLLSQFTTVFQEPKNLPPARSQDHHGLFWEDDYNQFFD